MLLYYSHISSKLEALRYWSGTTPGNTVFTGDDCLIGKYCGAGAGLSGGVATESRSVFAMLHTDGTDNNDGFRLYYQAVRGKKDETCFVVTQILYERIHDLWL